MYSILLHIWLEFDWCYYKRFSWRIFLGSKTKYKLKRLTSSLYILIHTAYRTIIKHLTTSVFSFKVPHPRIYLCLQDWWYNGSHGKNGWTHNERKWIDPFGYDVVLAQMTGNERILTRKLFSAAEVLSRNCLWFSIISQQYRHNILVIL